MDPNYKNFMAWKKSSRGKEFLAQKDDEDLQNIRQAGKYIFVLILYR